jgi:hypothetical protein
MTNSLHQKHEGNARHQSPVDDSAHFLVQSCHLALAEPAQGVEAVLNLLSRVCLNSGAIDSFGLEVLDLGGVNGHRRLFLNSGRHDDWQSLSLLEC